ncbi:MAG TPA: O-antigen ligase family protein [Bacteroidales bacterium]|nr:O-antigen ligase family protein [Bacteroidales bacterium]
MIEKFFRQFIRFGYLVGFAALLVSLAHTKYVMSVSQFILAGAFAMERFDLFKLKRFYEKQPPYRFYLLLLPYLLYLLFDSIVNGFREFFRNKPAMIFSSIFLLHILGLLVTSDFGYALKDLRTKLPLFLLPLFLSTSESFGRKNFYWLLILFSASVFLRTLINSWNLLEGNYVDIRDISKHISHIILGLLISLSVFYLGYLAFLKREFPVWMRILFSLTAIWMLVYLVLSKSATGLAVTAITFFLLLVILIFRARFAWIKTGLTIILVAAAALITIYLVSVYRDYYKVNPVEMTRLDKYTSRGNPYTNLVGSNMTENGNYIYLYLQFDEMRDAWNKRSKIPFDSLNRRNQPIVFTILRFLTSKGYRKDADGVNRLTDQEITAIEKGIPNVIFMKGLSIRGRIYEILWGYEQYKQTGNPTGLTMMQRLEFWKASAGIIKDNWLTGVGTGDMNTAFQNQYRKMNSKLAPDQRWRSHNQFLSITVGFGIFGLLWFLFALIYPPAKLGKFTDYFFLVFFIIAVLSMLPEDTIESQAGVTFFALFYSFLLFARKEDQPI